MQSANVPDTAGVWAPLLVVTPNRKHPQQKALATACAMFHGRQYSHKAQHGSLYGWVMITRRLLACMIKGEYEFL